MFEIGKDYKFTIIEGGDEGYSVWTVVGIEGTLLKLNSPYERERVINTASPNFVSAEPVK
jgi:hypothetical protein